MSGPINRHYLTQWSDRSHVDLDGVLTNDFHHAFIRLESAGLRVAEGGTRASLEVSVPKALCGDNLEPASRRDTRLVLDQLVSEAADYVEWSTHLEDFRVDRIDLDRDFYGVEDPSSVIANVARLPQRHSVKKYMDVDSGCESVTVATKTQWRAALYDKFIEAGLGAGDGDGDGPGRPGHLRFEVRLRSQDLRSRGIRTVRRLLDSDLEELARYYFERVGFGAPLGAVEPLVEALRRCSQMPEYKDAAAALGQALMVQQGLPIPGAPGTRRKRSNVARTLGIDRALASEGWSGRLDFDTHSYVEVTT